MFLIFVKKYPILAQNIRLLPKIAQSLPEFSRFLAKVPDSWKKHPITAKNGLQLPKKPVLGKKHSILDTKQNNIANKCQTLAKTNQFYPKNIRL